MLDRETDALVLTCSEVSASPEFPDLWWSHDQEATARMSLEQFGVRVASTKTLVDRFSIDGGRDEDAWKQLGEHVETADLRQGDQRSRVGDSGQRSAASSIVNDFWASNSAEARGVRP